jgi:SP family general alpha glucoside:H+ symporter-like MFS transporter
VFANGWLTERFGHRRVILVSLVFMTAFIFIPFFAPSIQVLLVGQILCGIPWGIFATMGPSYSSEVCPTALRGYLTAYVNMCWAIGQFVAAGVLQGLVSNTTEWGYRIPFAVQWVWPIPLFILTYLAPDSPWWLVRKGRIEDAEKAVKRLSSKSEEMNSTLTVAMMIHTNNLEQSLDTKSSYLDCFKGSNLRRTEIACCALAGQIMSGSSFAYSPTYFFSQAGLSTSDDYKLGLGGTAIAFLGTASSWILINRFGRRTIYLAGIGTLTCLLLIIGGLSYPAEHNNSVKYGQAAVTLCWLGTYSTTIGPLAFTIAAEMSATRLRAQTIALARNAYNIINIVSVVVEPYLINPTEANLKGKTAFFWFATAFLTFVWAFFRLPETKGRTYEELDLLFDKEISAIKFKGYKIDAYEEQADA